MNPTHIEHIGIAVTSLEESIPFFETLLPPRTSHCFLPFHRRGHDPFSPGSADVSVEL